MRRTCGALGLLLCVAASGAEPTVPEVRAACERAVGFAQTLAQQGGYLWWYRTDGSEQAGEGAPVPRTTVWVQPPGTPRVGAAYLRLYEVTGEPRYLAAATAAGEALAAGQLASGGWYAWIDFGPPPRQALYYRHELEAGKKRGKRRNTSTFDDDTTTAALRLLLALDGHHQGRHPAIHRALEVGLHAVLAAQYPCGAWPQVFEGPSAAQAVLPAQLPAAYPRQYPRDYDYWWFYTLNDNNHRNLVETLLAVWRARREPRFREAAVRAGEFLLRAQLPEPQPIWAQQYNFAMEPCWARKFEPPAASSLESVGVLETLLELWLETGDERFHAAVGPALAWFGRSRLPNGSWARFYELGTNRPLYLTRESYQLTYDDADLPTHYGFQHDHAERLLHLAALAARSRESILAERTAPPSRAFWEARAAELSPRVAAALDQLDAQGRWITVQTTHRGQPLAQPREVVEMQVLVERLELLADYLAARTAADTR